MEIKLKTRHILMLSRLFAKMEMKIEVKGKTQQELGADIIFGLLSNLNKGEQEFYDLLSDLTGNTRAVLEEMEISQLTDQLKIIFDQLGNFMKPPVKQM